MQQRLATAQAQLQALASNPSNTSTVAGLHGEQLTGDLLTATIWSWFAAGETNSHLGQSQVGIIENPGLSHGLFHSLANPIYSWGVIRQVTFPGVNIDVGHVRNLTWAKDNDSAKWVAYNRLRGQHMSALEGAVPERFFNDPSRCNPQGTATPNSSLPACPQGISAVKAIGIAAQAGQKIFTITQQVYAANPGIVSSQLWAHSQSTKDRVQQALSAGYEVTIHEAPISQNGWTGAGFALIDPSTGAGAYLIDGGSNGGFLLAFIFTVISISLVILVVLPEAFFLGLFLLFWELVNVAFWIRGINNAQNDSDFNKANFGQAVGELLGFFPAAGALSNVVKWFGLIFTFILGNLTLGW